MSRTSQSSSYYKYQEIYVLLYLHFDCLGIRCMKDEAKTIFGSKVDWMCGSQDEKQNLVRKIKMLPLHVRPGCSGSNN